MRVNRCIELMWFAPLLFNEVRRHRHDIKTGASCAKGQGETRPNLLTHQKRKLRANAAQDAT